MACPHWEYLQKILITQSNPTQEMCASIGVDPLASSKGFWSEMLGVGDFYYELGVQIIEVCMANSHKTGGLMELEDLRRRVARSRMSHRRRRQMAAQQTQSSLQSVSPSALNYYWPLDPDTYAFAF